MLTSVLLPAALLALLPAPSPAPQTGCTGTEFFACQSNHFLRGLVENDHLGYSVSACGDWNWNGDCTTGAPEGVNRPDVLAGAAYPFEQAAANPLAGRAQLYLTQDLCDLSPNLTIVGGVRLDSAGETQGEVFGWAVAFVGDLDGDCKSDFVVGAPRSIWDSALQRWSQRGRLYCFLSSRYPQTGSACIANSANLIIEGPADGSQFGCAVAEVGDFDGDGQEDFDWNGDGVPDVVVSAPGGPLSPEQYSGTVYVISGADIVAKANTCSDCTVATPLNVVQVTSGIQVLASWTGKTNSGFERRDRFGFSLAIAGEVGDPNSAHPDIVAGAPQFSGVNGPVPDGLWGPGYVRVLVGPAASQFYEFVGTGTNELNYGCFGYSVSGQIDIASMGSVPGVLAPPDGIDDILVGEPMYDHEIPGTTPTFIEQAGKAYVLDVKTPGLAAATLASARGGGAGWFFGWQVQGLGPFDGALSFSDSWAVCASRYGDVPRLGACPSGANCPNSTTNPGDIFCGKLFVYRGDLLRHCWSVTGESFRDSCGWDIARTGDLGGSPLPDLVFSSPRWAEVIPPPLGLKELGKVYLRLR